ncbi:MAG: protoporphyrinogen/coproporphyrinogen oxidase [Gemmatimonadaceae bacterium]
MPSDARNSARTISYTTANADAGDATDAKTMTRVLVIGGGFSGVAAGVACREHDCDVTLLEQHEVLGGRARSAVVGPHAVDVGAQLIASSFARATTLLAGASLEATRGRDVFVRGGEQLPVQFGSLTSMLRFGALGVVDKVRLGATMLPLLAHHGSSLRADANDGLGELDTVSARDYVVNAAGSRAADAVVEPALNAFYAVRGHEASLAFYLTLGRYGSDSELLATRDGWSSALAKAADGIRVECGVHADVMHVTSAGIVVRDAGGRTWEADAAVLATSAGGANALLRETIAASHPLRTWLRSVATRRTWTVALMLRSAAVSDAFGILADPLEATMVSACAIPGGRWATPPRASHVILAWPTPDAVDELRDLAAEDIVAAMMPEILRLVPAVRDNVERARVVRFDEGTPLAHPGFLAHRAEGRALAESLEIPVALAGDYLTMPFVEGAVASGELAAAHLLKRLARA